jgi:protein O-GlcNAc transferase
MLPTDTFFADVEKVIAEYAEADRPRMKVLVDELERIAKRVPRVADRCYAYEARLYAQMHDFELAKAAIEQALRVMPLDDNWLVLRGDIHRQAEEYSQAAQDYARVLEANPEAVTARMRLAEVHQASGDCEMALREINEALKHEPRSLRLIYRRGLILIDLRRANDALADLKAVVRLSPDEDLRHKAEQRLRELGVR